MKIRGEGRGPREGFPGLAPVPVLERAIVVAVARNRDWGAASCASADAVVDSRVAVVPRGGEVVHRRRQRHHSGRLLRKPPIAAA